MNHEGQKYIFKNMRYQHVWFIYTVSNQHLNKVTFSWKDYKLFNPLQIFILSFLSDLNISEYQSNFAIHKLYPKLLQNSVFKLFPSLTYEAPQSNLALYENSNCLPWSIRHFGLAKITARPLESRNHLNSGFMSTLSWHKSFHKVTHHSML